MSVINCVFRSNQATGQGGGVFNGGNGAFVDCLFIANAAQQHGGGVSNTHACDCTTSIFTNSVFFRNSSALAGGALANAHATATITNCIAWRNSDSAGMDPVSQIREVEVPVTTVVSYCDVMGGYFAGSGNIDANPLFVDPNGGDFRVSDGSPCIDAGDNAAVPADAPDLDGDGNVIEPLPIDLDGNARFVDQPAVVDTGNGAAPLVDMGAYEVQRCVGDVDGDSDIDLTDLAMVLASFLLCEGSPGFVAGADLNGTGCVDLTDLAILLSSFENACE